MDLGKIWHLRQSKEWSKERVVKIGSALRPVQYKKKCAKVQLPLTLCLRRLSWCCCVRVDLAWESQSWTLGLWDKDESGSLSSCSCSEPWKKDRGIRKCIFFLRKKGMIYIQSINLSDIYFMMSSAVNCPPENKCIF